MEKNETPVFARAENAPYTARTAMSDGVILGCRDRASETDTVCGTRLLQQALELALESVVDLQTLLGPAAGVRDR